MLTGGTKMVAHRCSATNGEDCMDLERRVVPGPGTRLEQGIADGDGRGIDEVPVLHPTEGPRQIDLLRPCVGEGSVGQGRHELFEWFVEPPIACCACDSGHLTFQIGSQDVCLIGAARGPCGHHHRPHQHPEIQLALALDDSPLLAQAVHLLLRQQRLKHRAYIIPCHGLLPQLVSHGLPVVDSSQRE
jgi:hypothetical protein